MHWLCAYESLCSECSDQKTTLQATNLHNIDTCIRNTSLIHTNDMYYEEHTTISVGIACPFYQSRSYVFLEWGCHWLGVHGIADDIRPYKCINNARFYVLRLSHTLNGNVIYPSMELRASTLYPLFLLNCPNLWIKSHHGKTLPANIVLYERWRKFSLW